MFGGTGVGVSFRSHMVLYRVMASPAAANLKQAEELSMYLFIAAFAGDDQ